MTDNQDIINFDEIRNIIENIKKLIKPYWIILFHRKVDNRGQILSFKVCIIIDPADKIEVEKNIYKNIESEIPFDVILYTHEEWEQLSRKKNSFANKILKRGTIINGKK